MGDAAAAMIRADPREFTGQVMTDEAALTVLTGATAFEGYAVY